MQNVSTRTPGFSVSLGHFFFRHRDWLLPVVMVGLCACFRPRYAFGSARWDAWLNLLGLALVLGGQAIRVLVIGRGNIARAGQRKRVHANALVVDGLFQHCRNPLYVANILIYTGVFVIFHHPAVYAIGIPTVLLVYHCIVAAEEHYLRGAFGEEYARYCERVGRWRPRMGGLGASLRGMGFRWAPAVFAEYTPTYCWITAIAIVMGRESAAHLGAEQQHARLMVLTALWGAATLAWLAIYRLERSR